jgi:hypothetical protein
MPTAEENCSWTEILNLSWRKVNSSRASVTRDKVAKFVTSSTRVMHDWRIDFNSMVVVISALCSDHYSRLVISAYRSQPGSSSWVWVGPAWVGINFRILYYISTIDSCKPGHGLTYSQPPSRYLYLFLSLNSIIVYSSLLRIHKDPTTCVLPLLVFRSWSLEVSGVFPGQCANISAHLKHWCQPKLNSSRFSSEVEAWLKGPAI